MKLYYAEALSPRKACAVARYLRSPIDYVRVDLAQGEQRSEWFLELNPNGKVPVLVEGGHVLWEANAIMCRLAQAAGSDIWPMDARQADVVRWLSWDAAHFTRFAGELYFEHLIRPHIGLGPADPANVASATAQFRAAAGVLDAHLSRTSWLVGEAPTIADFALGVTLPYAVPAHIPVDDFPAIRRWQARLSGLEGWDSPFPPA